MTWDKTIVGSAILSGKYFHKGEDFEKFLNRVEGIFSTELKGKIKEAIRNADLIPAGRSLFAAGNKGKRKSTMSNCYIVDSPKDNIESIYKIAAECARIFSYGGGCGVDISNLRPKDAKVNNAAITSSGACSFMELFNTTGNVIGQHGRRAALMIALSVEHPDIEEFLEVKRSGNKLSAANISVKFTDDFMKAVIDKKPFTLHFTTETGEKIERKINAAGFFHKFCETQWDWGDPGSIFIDTVRKNNLLSGYPEYKIDVSNPCAEFFGNAGNSCNLASLNLYNMVKYPFTEKACIDWYKLEETVDLGVRMLDEILDYGRDMQPLRKNKKTIDDWRSIGLGVFGLADMFVAMGIKYGSKESVQLTSKIMKVIFRKAIHASSDLAAKKGTFKKYAQGKTKTSPLIRNLDDSSKRIAESYGLRNGTLLSIAPTGSIATMTGETGGVEPMFAISYERTTHSTEDAGKHFKVYAKGVEDLLRYHKLPADLSDEEIKKRFPFVVTSHEINPLDRVRVQSAMQEWVDNAISSTVNLPHTATVEQIEEIYITAWQAGLKGITVFRDGCKRASILGVSKNDGVEYDSIIPPKRGSIRRVEGPSITKHTACARNMFVHVNKKDGKLFEVFTSSAGGCQSNISAITRLASLAIRSGIKVSAVNAELNEVKCPGCLQKRRDGEKDLALSCGNAIGSALEEVYKEVSSEKIESSTESAYMICPECGEKKLRALGKCVQCDGCGYSKCE